MGNSSRRGILQPVGVLALVLAIFAIFGLTAGTPAQAQVPGYNLLFGKDDGSAGTAAPAQSGGQSEAPQPSVGTGWLDLSAGDYAQVSQNAPQKMASATQKAIKQFRARLIEVVHRSPKAFEHIGTTLAAASPTGRGIYFLGVLVFAGLLLVVGQAVMAFYVNFVARPIFIRMQSRALHGYVDKLPVLVNRVLLAVVGILITVLVATAVGLFFYADHEATQLTVFTVFATYAAVVLVDTIWRVILAPFLAEFRLLDLSDSDARKLYRWLTIASGFGVIASAFCYWMQGLGLPSEVHVLFTMVLMGITVGLFLLLIRANRDAITGAILAGLPAARANWLQRATAVLWAPVGVVYLLVTWAELSFRLILGVPGGPERLLVPYVTLIAGATVYAGTIYLIERVFARRREIDAANAAALEAEAAENDAARTDAGSTDTGATDTGATDAAWTGAATAEAGDEAASGPRQSPDDTATRAATGDAIDSEGGSSERVPLGVRLAAHGSGLHTMEDLARRVASLFALGASIYMLTLFWVGTAFLTGNRWFETFFDILQVAFIGYIVFHATRIWLDRKIEDEGGDISLNPGDEGGGAGATRLATLLPLVRNFILAVILTSIGLILANKLGANVAPLFAGAGIVGLAIGFGSQALVRDILSGAFFLLDDAFRKGEYIDVGSVKGTVEKISIRSFQLRHHLGMLHTIPFGEIQHLTNFSRDWVMMKLPLRLTYDTDIEKVRKLIKRLGQELLEDPVVGAKFLQPLKSQGVIQMDDSAMIARVKFMTRPGDQWVVRKRVFAEIRALFEREGIKFAHREVTVRIPDLPSDRDLDENERKVVGAAARNALDVVEAERLPRTGTGGPADDR